MNINTQLSAAGPAIVSLANIGTVVAWQGTGNELYLALAPLADLNFQAAFDTRQQTITMPALTSFGHDVYLSWCGVGGGLNVAKILFSSGGGGATSIVSLSLNPAIHPISGVQVDTTPAIAVSGSQLVLAFRDHYKDTLTNPALETMWTPPISSNADVLFSGPYQLGTSAGQTEHTSNAPGFTSTATRGVFAAWKGAGNADISIANIAIPVNSSATGLITLLATITNVTGTSPALTAIGDVLYLAYKVDGGDEIQIVPESGFGSLAGSVATGQTTFGSPSLGVALDGKSLLLGWTGKNNYLNLQSF